MGTAAGFTTEDLIKMQDDLENEGKTEEQLEAERKAAEDTEKAAADKKAADEKAEADRLAAEEAKKKGEEDKDKDKDKGKEGNVNELEELRETVRKQSQALSDLTSKYESLHKVAKDKGLIDEEDEKARETKEAEAKKNFEARVGVLNQMVEMMALNPAYADVNEVVSQQHFNETIYGMARFIVAKEGGDLDETAKAVEQAVWALPNPYKYMYDMIKNNHPAYKKKEETEEEKKAREAKEEEERKKKEEEDKDKGKDPPKIPGSVSDLPGGGGKDTSGWTAAKIDDLDESELHTVPRDIYEKWLAGTLK